MANVTIFKNDTITLVKCVDGFWLYDKTRGMNLSMRAKTEQDAFIESLMYYQKRLTSIENDFKLLTDSVQSFISVVTDNPNID